MRTDLKLLTIEDLCRELAVVRRDAGRSHREITAEIERRVNSTQAENADLRERVAVIEEWTHRFGSELSPSGKWTDSFGDGIRAAKERVSRILAAAKPAAQEGKEAADG